jgi:hypothetical protein
MVEPTALVVGLQTIPALVVELQKKEAVHTPETPSQEIKPKHCKLEFGMHFLVISALV